MSLAKKSEKLCNEIWRNTIDYAKATNAPFTLGYLLYIWCALYYCVLDIIEENNAEYEVRKSFIETTCQHFDLELNNDLILNSLVFNRQYAIEEFQKHSIDPLSKSDLFKLHRVALILANPDVESKDSIAPSIRQEAEFMLAVSVITHFASEQFSRNSAYDPSSPAQGSPATHSKKTHWGTIVFIFTAILALFFVFIIFFSSNAITTASPTTSIIQTTEPKKVLVEKDRPNNGFIFAKAQEECLAPLTIIAPHTYDCYYVLEPLTNEDHAIKFYGRAGETVEIDVPLGKYELYYATGLTWYGRTHLFGEQTIYQKCDVTLDFAENSEGYSGWTIQLNLVENGNLDSDPIPESSFPK